MMMSALYQTNALIYIFIMLAHWHNSLQINMGKLYEEIDKFSIKIKHMYERDTNEQEISDTFRNVLSQSMDKYIPSKKF